MILSISGFIKTNKQILKYIMATFKKKNNNFFNKNESQVSWCKIKTFYDNKKKARKRHLKMEQKAFFA